MTFDKAKLSIRPKIESVNNNLNSLQEEIFQNNVLRPIIKFQNDIIIEFFNHHLITNKIDLNEVQNTNQKAYVFDLISNNHKLKSELKMLVIAHFTTDEFYQYKKNYKAINKRIINMIIQKIQSSSLITD